MTKPDKNMDGSMTEFTLPTACADFSHRPFRPVATFLRRALVVTNESNQLQD
jgi:hypothetical protein